MSAFASSRQRVPSAALPDLFESGVSLALIDPADGLTALYDAELPAIATAHPPRQREFIAGRMAARAAMVALGTPPRAVPQGQDRAPVWPQDLVGSIAHCEGLCLAAVAPKATHAGLGVDVEPAQPLPQDLWPEICTSAELHNLACLPAKVQGLRATLTFCAKEAAYKCQYVLSHEMFGFDMFTVDVDPVSSTFCAIFNRNSSRFPKGFALQGRYVVRDGRILTGVALPARKTRLQRVH